jgi:hypothetical protein
VPSLKKLPLLLALAATLATPAFAAPPETANAIFANAKSQAQHEHKDILFVFSASWCGPCKLYERFLQDPQMKAITDKAFIVARIDVGERKDDAKHANTPGGVQLRTALGSADEPGFPWLVLTDENGTPLINSYRNSNMDGNIGYPAAPEEIDWYIEMLKHAPALSSADLAATRVWLQQHTPR